jgi:hypothetical protein
MEEFGHSLALQTQITRVQSQNGGENSALRTGNFFADNYGEVAMNDTEHR